MNEALLELIVRWALALLCLGGLATIASVMWQMAFGLDPAADDANASETEGHE